MPFDFKKEYKELYWPKAKLEIVAVPAANYIAVRGKGDQTKKRESTSGQSAEFLAVDEGLCVQAMHLGPFDDEPATVAMMNEYLAQKAYANDLSAGACITRFTCPTLEKRRLLAAALASAPILLAYPAKP